MATATENLLDTHIEALVTGTWRAMTNMNHPYTTMVHIVGEPEDDGEEPRHGIVIKGSDTTPEDFLAAVKDKMAELKAVWVSMSAVTQCGQLRLVVETPTTSRQVVWNIQGDKLMFARRTYDGPKFLFPNDVTN